MWELDCEESRALKKWCFWTVVLEKTPESPLDCKEIQPVHSEGDQSWMFFGRNDAKAETPVLWPPHAKSWLIGKDSDAGRDWGQEEKGTTEDKMAGWHHRLYGHEFEWVNSGSWWWTGRPGMLRFMGSQRVGHNWVTELNWTDINIMSKINWFFKSLGLPWWLRWLRTHLRWRRPGFDPWIGKILWRREWLSTSVFLPGKSRGQRSLVGYHGVAESDMTEQLTLFKSLSLGQFITQS